MRKKISVFSKLMAANLAYAIPLAIVCYFLVEASQENIDFAEREYEGSQVVARATNAMVELSLHRLESQRVLNGLDSRESFREKNAEKIGKAFAELKSISDKYAKELRLNPAAFAERNQSELEPSRLADQWNALQSGFKQLTPAKSNQLHSELISNLQAFIAYVGDTSNLILDPDLDSYYLMDVVVLGVPETINRVQDLTANLEPFVRTGNIPEGSYAKIEHQLLTIEELGFPRLKASAEVALKEDEHFYGLDEELQQKMPTALNTLISKKEEFENALDSIKLSRTLNISASSFVDHSTNMIVEMHDFAEASVSLLENVLESRQSHFHQRKVWAISGSVFTILMCSLFLFWISRSFSGQMRKIVERLSKASSGTSEASQELVAMSQQLSSASTEQASAIQESVATVNEINAMVTKTLENTRLTIEVSNNSRTKAQDGQNAVEQMISSINEISDSNSNILNQVESSNRQISEIVDVINEIGAKTKVINDIVFQTKLLSFNASVEAARAGEHGKGFAVVAEEVGNLAQMSGNAAKEIGDMLTTSIDKVNGIVESTRGQIENLISIGKAKVESGKTVAHQCGQSLNAIVEAVNDMNGKVVEITKAAEEQSRGVNEITKAMNQLEEATNQNSSMASETANQSRQLSDQAAEITQITGDVRVEVFGGSTKGSDDADQKYFETKRQARKFSSTPSSKKDSEVEPQVKLKSFGPDEEAKPAGSNGASKPVPGKRMSVVGLPDEADPRFEDI